MGLDLCQPKFPEEKAAEFGLQPYLTDALGGKHGTSEDQHK